MDGWMNEWICVFMYVFLSFFFILGWTVSLRVLIETNSDIDVYAVINKVVSRQHY